MNGKHISNPNFDPYSSIDGDKADPWGHVRDPNKVNLVEPSSAFKEAVAARALDDLVKRPKHRATSTPEEDA